MHVMIAVDGSEAAHDAAEVAVGMFGRDVDYSIVSVGTIPMAPPITPLGLTPALYTLAGARAGSMTDLNFQAEDIVEEVADELDLPGAEQVADRGGPGPTICALAEERNADVIVIGAHERGWWSRVMEGSTQDHLVRNAPCSVLVVRGATSEG